MQRAPSNRMVLGRGPEGPIVTLSRRRPVQLWPLLSVSDLQRSASFYVGGVATDTWSG